MVNSFIAGVLSPRNSRIPHLVDSVPALQTQDPGLILLHGATIYFKGGHFYAKFTDNNIESLSIKY